ncbi:MAG: 2-keto-4-pentenoate hydratase [Microbacterium sp.]|nr:2-keto-4-pentenoate hydratase [Microbacterium sp.]
MNASQTASAQRVAADLLQALRTGRPIAPIRDRLDGDVDAAYDVQAQLIDALQVGGATRVGRKVGLTSAAVQAQLGVDQPDFGVLLSNMAVPSGGGVDLGELVAPRIEAEVAFVLAKDVTDPSPTAVLEAVDYAVGALEIVDSRIEGWDISIVDTVADNASSARFVLGRTRLPLSEFSPRDVEMVLHVNGATASTGDGAACLGDPVNALVWVAQTAARLGDPLRAGEVVLSGALGPMVPLTPGAVVTAQIGALGEVSVTAERTHNRAQ